MPPASSALDAKKLLPMQVLALRDEHIRLLQDEQQVFDLGNHYLQSSSQKLLTGGAAGGGALTLGITAGPLTTRCDARVKEGWGRGGAGRQQLKHRIAQAPHRCTTACWRARRRPLPRAHPCLHAPPHSPPASEIKAVKGMPSEAVIGRWKETVRELGNLLVQIEGVPDQADPRHQAAMAALCQVLDSAGQLCMHTAVLHPTNMQKLIAATLDDGRSGVTAEDRGRWASVTASLQLAGDQRAQIVSLRAIFLRRMTKVCARLVGAVGRSSGAAAAAAAPAQGCLLPALACAGLALPGPASRQPLPLRWRRSWRSVAASWPSCRWSTSLTA